MHAVAPETAVPSARLFLSSTRQSGISLSLQCSQHCSMGHLGGVEGGELEGGRSGHVFDNVIDGLW